MTPVEMAAKSDSKPGWVLTPSPVVAFAPNPGHQNGQGLYLKLVGNSGSDQFIFCPASDEATGYKDSWKKNEAVQGGIYHGHHSDNSER